MTWLARRGTAGHGGEAAGHGYPSILEWLVICPFSFTLTCHYISRQCTTNKEENKRQITHRGPSVSS